MASEPQIVGLGGHGDAPEQTRALMRHVLSLTGKERPRVMNVPTAVGDDDTRIVAFYELFADLGRSDYAHASIAKESYSTRCCPKVGR